MSTVRFNTWQDSGGTEVANSTLGTGKILQVVSTTKTDTFSTTSTSMTDITGLTVSITPTSTTSKILVFADVAFDASALTTTAYRMMRDSTPVGVGDAAGSRPQVSKSCVVLAANRQTTTFMSVLDSPSSTSALAYHVECAVESGNTLYVNRRNTDTDSSSLPNSRSVSTITVMEVSA